MNSIESTSMSLANRIRGVDVIDSNSCRKEERDNSLDKDADADYIFNVLIDEPGLCMFVHGDNGKGMSPGKILQPSTNKMKGGGNRGQYFVGALNSMLSTGAEVVFEFSKEEGKKLKLMKYKAGPMIDHVRDRFAQGEDGNTITREL